ncbi:phage protein Gp36 family protein [Chryseobacterium sp. T1]
MPFLIKDDLKTVATLEIIDLITNSDDGIVEEIIDECIDVMKTYLGSYYDMELSFAKEDNERNKTLVKYLKALVIYEIPKRRGKRVPRDQADDYNEAMNWLEKVAAGEWRADLPPKKEETEDGSMKDVGFYKLKSNKSYRNHW